MALNRMGIRLHEGVIDHPYHAMTLLEFAKSYEICNKCKNPEECQAPCIGYVKMVDENANPFVRPCKMYETVRAKKKIEAVLANSQIPVRYSEMSLNNYEIRANKGLDVLMHMNVLGEKENGLGAFICGSTGVGKTHLAVGALRKCMDDGKSGVFVNAPELMSKLRGTQRGQGSEEEIMQALEECDVLVIDDLGAERPTDFVGECLYRLVNSRYVNRRITVITSNYSPSQLIERLGMQGQRICSRVSEMCKLFRLDGEDYRRFKSE